MRICLVFFALLLAASWIADAQPDQPPPRKSPEPAAAKSGDAEGAVPKQGVPSTPAPEDEKKPAASKPVKSGSDSKAAPVWSKWNFADITGPVNDTLGKFGIEIYGHFKLDTSHDSAETNFGDTASFVKNYAPGDRDDEFNMTARHSRLGFNWYGPEFEGVKAFGKIEMDFLGKSVQKNTETQELQPAGRLRHAYVKFDLPKGWSVIAGQTWDNFAPINMKKLNTLVGWGQGNVGFRRPQLRITKAVKVDEKTRVKFAIAATRSVARDKDGGGQDDGEGSGAPDVQGRIELQTPALCGKPMKLGVSGFVGWRKIDSSASNPFIASDESYRSYAGAVDFQIPILKNVELIGEAWAGRALDGYRGGIWQSYSTRSNGTIRVISAYGFWGNLIWNPHKKWRLLAGYGQDNPDSDDMIGNNERVNNQSIFGNVLFKFYRGASVGLEYDRMDTDYVNRRDRVNHRVQMSIMLKF